MRYQTTKSTRRPLLALFRLRFRRSSKDTLTSAAKLFLAIGLLGCLGSLALLGLRRPASVAGNFSTARPGEVGAEPETSGRRLEGNEAREFLEHTGESESLKAAVTAARFGLTWQKRAPIGDVVRGGGYLGVSHDQNISAWFDDEGLTVLPTAPKQGGERAWRMRMRLGEYGYGQSLRPAPPIISRQVKGNRVEYERRNVGVEKPSPVHPKLETRNPTFVEWYENGPSGIEQGFNIAERPERSGDATGIEPLRLSLKVSGDLRARVNDEGQE